MGYIGAGITRFNTADELTVTGDATFDTNTLYVDSANNRVGIGTTGPVRALDIATTTGGTIIHLTDDSTGHLATDGVDIQQEGTLFQILNREAGDIRLGTNGSERLRIDSSGNLLVGKTANSIAGAGIVIRGGGELFSTRAGDVAGFNRLTTDGPIVQFYKDGSVVGGVGNDSSNLFINFSQTNNVGVAAGTSGGNPVLFPTGNTGAVRDDAVSLGYSSGRFKDLYLSGGVYLGGTGSANLLSDYETGTWTPTFQASTDPTVTYATRYGKYTKIGSLVTCLCILTTDGVSGGSGALKITGLPFAEEATVGTSVIGHAWSGEIPMKIRISSSSAFLYYRSSIHASDINNNTQVSDMATGSGGNNRIEFTITYTTAS